MSKITRTYRLSKQTLEYLESYATAQDCGITAALERIVFDHSQRHMIKANHQFAEQVADLVCKKLDATLVRIRLGSNGADRNSQILIELLNGLYAYNDIPSLVSTQQLTTPALAEARRVVKERIENFRIKQLERKQKKGE